MIRTTLWTSLLVLALDPTIASAQSLSPRDVDARLDNQLYDVLRVGTDLYNRGDREACYRLYQGSLLGIVGFLDHRPDQATQIRRALRDSENLTSPSERAFALRAAIDELRNTFKPTPATAATPTTPAAALWDRLGGETGVTTLVDDFVSRTLANPRVNFTRRGTGREWDANPEKVARLKKAMVALVSASTGGPLRYEGRDMKSLHAGMKITEAEFQDVLTDLKASFEKNHVTLRDQDEVLKLLLATKPDIVEAVPGPPRPPEPPPPTTRSLWERLGGEPMVKHIVDHFTVQVLTDSKINFIRQGTGKRWFASTENVDILRRRLVQMISSVTGGPIKYEGRDMKAVHQGMGITEPEFDALVNQLKASLDKFKIGIKEQEELLRIVNGTRADIIEKR